MSEQKFMTFGEDPKVSYLLYRKYIVEDILPRVYICIHTHIFYIKLYIKLLLTGRSVNLGKNFIANY